MFAHYGLQNFPVFIIPTAWAFDIVVNIVKDKGRYVKAAAATVFLILTSATLIFNIFVRDYEMFTASESNTETVATIRKYSDYDDRILIIGFHPYIYCQSERLPVSRYSYQLDNAMNEKDFETFIETVKSSKPKVIVDKTYKDIYPGIREALNDFINAYYDEVEENIFVLKAES